MIFHEQPDDDWDPFDFMLLEAYQILQDETCNECGNPIWICRNEDATNVGFKVKVAKCFAKAELDKWQETQEKKSAKKSYGEYPYVIAHTYDDGPMPSRNDYYTSLMEKHKVE